MGDDVSQKPATDDLHFRGQQKCLKCGRFMRKTPDYQIWTCRCGGWAVGLADLEHMQIATEVLLARGCA